MNLSKRIHHHVEYSYRVFYSRIVRQRRAALISSGTKALETVAVIWRPANSYALTIVHDFRHESICNRHPVSVEDDRAFPNKIAQEATAIDVY